HCAHADLLNAGWNAQRNDADLKWIAESSWMYGDVPRSRPIAISAGADREVDRGFARGRRTLVLRASLRKDRARMRRTTLALDALPLMAWVADLGGKIEYVNERYVAYTGDTPGDV